MKRFHSSGSNNSFEMRAKCKVHLSNVFLLFSGACNWIIFHFAPAWFEKGSQEL